MSWKSRPGQLVPNEWRAARSPWTPDAELARVLILRASILWCYSHVEQKLTDMMIRCASQPEYRDLKDNPPFSTKSRISYLRAVFKTPGPLSKFRCLGLAVLDRYDASRNVRNQMAHADMCILPNWAVTFDEIIIDGNSITHNLTKYWPGELEAMAVKASRFSRACQRLHYNLFSNDPITSGDNDDAAIVDWVA